MGAALAFKQDQDWWKWLDHCAMVAQPTDRGGERRRRRKLG